MKRFVLGMTTALAATVSATPADSCAVKKSKVEVFLGAELHYRDIYFNKMYEVLVNLSPGVKWHLGGKNGVDCYSKNGHAVTVLTRQS